MSRPKAIRPSRPTITPIKLAKDHPYMQLGPEDPVQLHGTFDMQHMGRSFSVILTRDELTQGHGIPDWRWHLSVAGRDMEVPAWNTLAAVAHEIRPGVPFAIGVPPRSQWLNVHSGCLHLWQINDPNLTDTWRMERRGDTPS